MVFLFKTLKGDDIKGFRVLNLVGIESTVLIGRLNIVDSTYPQTSDAVKLTIKKREDFPLFRLN